MGLALVLTYIALNLLSPADMFPALIPLRPLLLLGVMNLPLALLARLRAPEVSKLRTQFLLVLMFYGWASVALIPHRLYGANLTTLVDLAPNLLAYFLGVLYFRSPQRLRLVRAVLLFVALFIFVNALMELRYAHASQISTPYVLVVHGPTVDSAEYRIRGLGMLQDPNTYGQFVLLVLPLLFVAKRDSGLGMAWFGALGTSILFLFAVYLTGSRGAMLGVAVLTGLYLIRRLKATGAILATLLGGLVLLAANAYNTRHISVSGGMDRLSIWSTGMSYVKQSPIWGIGPRGFGNEFGMTAHNSYLLVAAELGIIGLFLWMSMSVVTLIQLGRITRMEKVNPEVARWALGLRVSLGGYLFTSFFLSRAYELPLYMLLGMCGGIIVAAGGDDAVPLRRSMWPVWSMVCSVGILTLIYVMLRLRFA
jgi:putative inorganic carbon (hco3(-)) transporter